ncbi:MAG TPA: matrixin family metalloprotease [Polyangiaceae bacterium]|nr:matrixin family metalloprotease [Polyangiaceae bacterium]
MTEPSVTTCPPSHRPPPPVQLIPSTLHALAASNQPKTARSAPVQANPRRSARPKQAFGIWHYLGLSAVAAATSLGLFAYAHSRGEHGTSRVPPDSAHPATASLKQSAKGHPVRWQHADVVVALDDSIDTLGPTARNSIKEAFTAWTKAGVQLPNPHFERTSKVSAEPKPDGVNSVTVAPITIAGHEHDLAITLTYSDEDTGEIVEADIVINSLYPYRVLNQQSENAVTASGKGNGSQAGGEDSATAAHISSSHASCTSEARNVQCEQQSYDVQNVVTHEVGHFFGLGEDMTDASATMYYCTNRCETHKRELTSGDMSAVTELYQAGFVNEAAGCGGAHFAARKPTWLPFLGVSLGLLLVTRGRRASRRRSA